MRRLLYRHTRAHYPCPACGGVVIHRENRWAGWYNDLCRDCFWSAYNHMQPPPEI